MEHLIESIEDSPFLTEEHLARLTSQFVSIPSVNGVNTERDLALVIASQLDDVGFDTYTVGDERRPSIAAVRGAGHGGVVLNGHLDTVPVEDPDSWEFPPFTGHVSPTAVHGRGACDMKGGLAVQVAVAQWLAANDADGRIVLHFAMGEERGEPGTEDLIEAGFVAPLGIVLEPTDLQIGVAQRGLVTLEVTVEGRAGHASRPDLTNNPIAKVPEILSVVERLDSSPERRHDLLGTPALTVTGLHAGVIPSMVPAEVRVLVDRRMVPGETAHAARQQLEDAIRATVHDAVVRVVVVEGEGVYEPAEVDPLGRSATGLAKAIEVFGGEAVRFGTPYASDVRHLVNTAGVDAVTFGPGRFAEMHARDESVRKVDLQRAARAVAAYCHALMET
ncbi:MAG: M20/M25/M40 family metallo-hydrolase [Acidimicrobiia bacterium]|jgi:succinyl-diaminopimelate desuccinylase